MPAGFQRVYGGAEVNWRRCRDVYEVYLRVVRDGPERLRPEECVRPGLAHLLQLGVPGVKPALLDVRNCRYDEAWDVREPPDGLYAALPDATDADAYALHRITPETMHGTH